MQKSNLKIVLSFALPCLTALLLTGCGDSNKETIKKEETKMNTEEKKEINEVHAKHILVDTEAKANEILKKINDGELSFEDAAMQFSSCPSKQQGGDLGYFGRGAMVKEFEEAAFNTEKDQISAPVQTQFGWHLIKVIDKR